MKATAAQRPTFMNSPVVYYPNAASRRQVFHKMLDVLLVTASGAGIGAILLFLLAIA